MYKSHSSGLSIIRISDGATIPIDNKNRDYVLYLSWKDSGGVLEPADDTTESVRAQEQVKTLERESMLSREVREVLLALFDILPQNKQTGLTTVKDKIQILESKALSLRK